MGETPLKAKLTKTMRDLLPDYFVVERHEDKIISGRPDICITGLKVTTRWEVKHANPNFKHKGVQTDTMLKLATAGFAWYIVFVEPHQLLMRTQRIYIVDPKDIDKPISTWKDFTEGYNYKWVVQRVWKEHHYDRK